MTAIGSALGRLTGGTRNRGRPGPETALLTDPKPQGEGKPITDPEQLERRRQALANARAARAEARAARAEARAARAEKVGGGEGGAASGA